MIDDRGPIIRLSADIGGDDKLAKLGGVSTRTPNRFRHCANSVQVAGDGSRHGDETKAPPKDPMTLDEAAAYVRQVLNAWLAMKAGLTQESGGACRLFCHRW